MLNLPTDKDNETAEDILIFLNLLQVSEYSDHIQRHLIVVDPQDDKDCLIAEVASIVQKNREAEQERIVYYMRRLATNLRAKLDDEADEVALVIEQMITDLFPNSPQIGGENA